LPYYNKLAGRKPGLLFVNLTHVKLLSTGKIINPYSTARIHFAKLSINLANDVIKMIIKQNGGSA